MNVPVRSTLPLNTLSPMALAHKFRYHHPGGFAGLGDCLVYDETGACVLDDGSGGGGPITGGTCPGAPGCPGYVSPIDNSFQIWAESGNGMYMDANGNIILPSPSGGYTSISPSGQAQTSAASPPSASQGGITPQQAQMYASIISSLTNAGARIAAITNLPAGATLLPNGTIVGAGQSFSSGGVNATLAALFKSPVLLVVGAVVVLMAMER